MNCNVSPMWKGWYYRKYWKWEYIIPIDVPCGKGQWWAAYVWKTSPRSHGWFTLGSCCVTANCPKQVPSNSRFNVAGAPHCYVNPRYVQLLAEEKRDSIRKDRKYWFPELSNSAEQRIDSLKGNIYKHLLHKHKKYQGKWCVESAHWKVSPAARLHLKLPKNVIQEASKRLKLPETEGQGIGWICPRYRITLEIQLAESEWLNQGQYYIWKWDSTAILTGHLLLLLLL